MGKHIVAVLFLLISVVYSNDMGDRLSNCSSSLIQLLYLGAIHKSRNAEGEGLGRGLVKTLLSCYEGRGFR